uniref:Uncharacterized protein n=1 Tax=Macrostomum lignano TaxID=282301 RepID=A0A1I8FZT1_9PLAT
MAAAAAEAGAGADSPVATRATAGRRACLFRWRKAAGAGLANVRHCISSSSTNRG